LNPWQQCQLHERRSRPRAAAALATPAAAGADPAVAAGQALRRGLEALALLETRDAPELRWRVCATLAQAYVALDRAEDARHFLMRTASARTRLEERIPAEMRPTFFERRDRRDLQDAVDRAAARLQQAHPKEQMAPAELLPAGASLLRLLEVNKQLNSEHHLDNLLNMIMDAVIDLTGAERGFIVLRDEGKLSVEVARNIDRETIKKSKYKISQSIAEQVIETGAAVFATDAQEDERYRDYVSIHALKLRSIVCIPLKDRDSTFGAIYLDNRFQANAFNEEHRGLLEAFAEQAAVAITNARLHERNRVIMEELKRSRDQVERLNRELERKLVDQTAVLQETREALTRRQDQIEQRYRYGQLIGHSEPMQRVYGLIDRVKEIDVSVIIHGESGTGKELVARAIHYNGARRKQEFVSINCAAFPETLLESELFGHKKGSFTGADRDKKGLFQVAHRGTLFLDEVGDMSLGMQAKLLRALQEHEVRPVGGHEALKVDVRIIAASNQDLKELIRLGRFREDLFYRLNVVTIRIPPLRERREDIPALVEAFLERSATRTGQEKRTIGKEAMKVLLNYDWPGNVRELESTVTTASLFALTSEIQTGDLANKPELMESAAPRPLTDLGERSLDDLEREAIIQALVRTKGNKMAAAKVLGISRRSLYNKLTQYDIQLTRKTTIVR
jgi:transcriptional regulator with GAF, ATPase, and Fis domain